VEIEACRVWLDQERSLVKPAVLVLLGASAARAVFGRAMTISRERGRAIEFGEGHAFITIHPSYVLRLPDQASKQREFDALVSDLCTARSFTGLKTF
jgi:DNA polymerase